jgi:hypothetical protein
LETRTWAMSRSVGSAPSTRWAGAGAWRMAPAQRRQAYLGRMVTSTRNWAGTMSSRSTRSSPIRVISPQPQGQRMLAGSMTRSMRGSASGSRPWLRLIPARAGRDAAWVALARVLASSAAATAVSFAIVARTNGAPMAHPRRRAGARPRPASRTACRRGPAGTRRRDVRAGDCARSAPPCPPPAPAAGPARPRRRRGSRAAGRRGRTRARSSPMRLPSRAAPVASPRGG